MTRVIGLTGGMGSGKSTISQFLAELGAIVIDADKIGHESYLPNTDTHKELVNIFGKTILAKDNTIDRKKLGTIVFSHPEELKRFNAIVHPRMLEMAKQQIAECRRKGIEIVVLDAPILFEANWALLVDEVWVVTSDKANVIKRTAARTGLPEEQIRSRISSQMSDDERIKRAKVVIRNDGTNEDLHQKVKQLWDNLKV